MVPTPWRASRLHWVLYIYWYVVGKHAPIETTYSLRGKNYTSLSCLFLSILIFNCPNVCCSCYAHLEGSHKFLNNLVYHGVKCTYFARIQLFFVSLSRGVGCIFYEMITGRPLFPGSTVEDELHLIFRILGETVKSRLAFAFHLCRFAKTTQKSY